MVLPTHALPEGRAHGLSTAARSRRQINAPVTLETGEPLVKARSCCQDTGDRSSVRDPTSKYWRSMLRPFTAVVYTPLSVAALAKLSGLVDRAARAIGDIPGKVLGVTTVAGLVVGTALFAFAIPARPPSASTSADRNSDRANGEDSLAERFPAWYGEHPERTLTIDVSVSERTSISAIWRSTYTLTLSPADPVVKEFRKGDWADDPSMLTELLGGVEVYPSDRQSERDSYFSPTLTLSENADKATVRWGSVVDNELDLKTATVVVVRYTNGDEWAPISSANLSVQATRFTVVGIRSIRGADSQANRFVEMTINGRGMDDRVALVQDGYPADSASTVLNEDSHDDTPTDESGDSWVTYSWLGLLLASLAPWLLILSARSYGSESIRWMRFAAAVAITTILRASQGVENSGGALALTLLCLAAFSVIISFASAIAGTKPDLQHATAIWTDAAGYRRLIVGAATIAALLLADLALSKALDYESKTDYVLYIGAATAWLVAASASLIMISEVSRSARWTAFGTFGALAITAIFPLDLYLEISLLFIAPLFLMLDRRGQTAAALGDPSVRRFAIAFATIPLVAVLRQLPATGWTLAASAVVLVGGLMWLTPLSKSRIAVVLGGLSPDAHRLLLRRQIHERVVLEGATKLYRSTKDGLDASAIDQAESTRRRRALEAAERTSMVPRALGSGGGHPPSANGKAGATYGLLLTLPTTIATTSLAIFSGTGQMYANLSSGLSPQIAVLLAVLRWGFYGFVFGYLYPRIRGRDSMAKALGFTLIVVLAETIGIAGAIGTISSPAQIVAICAVLAPGLTMVAGLGLVWERRLTVEAGLPWRMVRKLGDFRTFTAPVVSIVIATVSSAATSAVGLLLSVSPKGR